MAEHRTRKNKENPNYSFLYSWTPGEARVKRESDSNKTSGTVKLSASKRAEIQAKEETDLRIKKDIVKSLFLVIFVLTIEVVVYLARNKFILP